MTQNTAMGIDKSEAAAALAAAGASEERSSSLYGYRFNAPLLFLWGAIWMIVDLTITFAPSPFIRNWGWNIGSLAGLVLSSLYFWRYHVANRRQASSRSRSRKIFWRMMATWLFSGSFVIAVLMIFAPFSWRDIHTFWGLFVALIYACYGVWNGWRMTVIGVLLGVLSLFAFLVLPDREYVIFMGVVCGGGMILGGLWLRTA